MVTAEHMLEGIHEAVAAVDEQQQCVDVDALDHIEEGLARQRLLSPDSPFPDSTAVLHADVRVLAGQNPQVDGLEALVEERSQLLELFPDRPARRL